MTKPQDLICIGAIAGAFGVRGEMRVKSFTASPEAVFDYQPWLNAEGEPILTLASVRPIKDGFAAFCHEVATREEAMAMKSTALYVPRAAMAAPDEDEFYYADLIGMTAQALDGTPMGTVRSVQDFGATDLLEISGMDGVKETFFIPFTRAGVPHVDMAGRRVMIDPAEAALPEAVLVALASTVSANTANDQD
jgi:16S rRNA processing protein RimM